MPLGGRHFRGFPFEEEEGSGAWSDLAARHPDIAARLRQHPAAANWARKRRPSNQDADEFGDSFSNFDRFPFDEIPPEFREHFPSHFNRRFGQREERAPQHPQSPPPQTSQSPPRQQTTATQTERDQPEPAPQHTPIPQYGLRNTVDLGQKSAADPSLVDADERNHRSVSAPPESRNHAPKMNAQNHQETAHGEQPAAHPSKVRNIPIFVEGRDDPVINETVDSASHFGDAKPTFHHPQQPPFDNSYFAEDAAPYTQPPNFSKAFGTPYSKPFRQGSQPFVQQKVFPQTYARGASPARSQSPKPKEEVKIPVQHEGPKPQARPEPPRPQPKPQQPPKPQQQAPPPPPQPQQQQPPKEPTPPPASKPQPPDPITQILSIQTDVLNLMTDVENFTGTKKDKRCMYLDEMLTRNLIKLDNIETEGKENIRNARKEAIKCIQKCIAVLEAKAESNSVNAPQQENQESKGQDTEMNAEGQTEEKPQNGEMETKESGDGRAAAEKATEEQKSEEPAPVENKEAPQAADTRPNTESKPEGVDKVPKKATKNTKKRDKSKDKSTDKDQKLEPMQVDEKGESKNEPQQMEVDSAASQ